MTATRRQLLVGSATTAAGALAWAGVRQVGMGAVDRWARALSRVPVIHDLGIEYSSRYPADTSDAALDAHVADLAARLSFLRDDSADRETVRARMREDFLGQEWVSLGGWRLSRTELRICALAARAAGRTTGTRGVFSPAAAVGPGDGGDDGGVRYWTAPLAQVRVVPDDGDWECRLRVGGSTPQRVGLKIDGRPIDERTLQPGSWQRIHYPVRTREQAGFELTLETSPAWEPPGDFRTFGVALDRVWPAAAGKAGVYSSRNGSAAVKFTFS